MPEHFLAGMHGPLTREEVGALSLNWELDHFALTYGTAKDSLGALEDLWGPGTFRANLELGEPIFFTATAARCSRVVPY